MPQANLSIMKFGVQLRPTIFSLNSAFSRWGGGKGILVDTDRSIHFYSTTAIPERIGGNARRYRGKEGMLRFQPPISTGH